MGSQESSSIEKLKKSTNHIGVILLVISILLIVTSTMSIVLTALLSSNLLNIFPEEISFLITQNSSSILTYSLFELVTICIMIFVLILSKKLRKDDLTNPTKTFKNVLLVSLFFILNYLINALYNFASTYTYSTEGIVEQSTTFSIPILEIVLLVVLIKNLVSLKKLEKE